MDMNDEMIIVIGHHLAKRGYLTLWVKDDEIQDDKVAVVLLAPTIIPLSISAIFMNNSRVHLDMVLVLRKILNKKQVGTTFNYELSDPDLIKKIIQQLSKHTHRPIWWLFRLVLWPLRLLTKLVTHAVIRAFAPTKVQKAKLNWL